MYERSRFNSRVGTERRIIIDEVNTRIHTITGHDSYGRKVEVSFDFQGAVVAVPMQGELWIITQYHNEWRLDRKAEIDVKTPITELGPGDRKIEAPGDLILHSGGSTSLNGQLLNANSSGAFADRPAPEKMPNAFYFSTDTVVLYFSDGTNWHSI